MPHAGLAQFHFDGIGTSWEISTAAPLDAGTPQPDTCRGGALRLNVVQVPRGLADQPDVGAGGAS